MTKLFKRTAVKLFNPLWKNTRFIFFSKGIRPKVNVIALLKFELTNFFVFIHTYTCVYMCMFVYIYIYICVCVCVCVLERVFVCM